MPARRKGCPAAIADRRCSRMTAPNPRTFAEHLRRAHAALRAGQAATAERLLRALEAQSPGEVNCLWLLGAALLEQDKIAESIAASNACCATLPILRMHAWISRALTARAGRAAQAREEVRRVLEKLPHHHRAWLAYGDVLVDLGQYQPMRGSPSSARGSAIRSARASRRRPRALVADERKHAEILFREILQRDASHVAALCGLAALSLAAGCPHDAERLLRHALKQSQHLPLAYRGLGPALLALGRVEEADAAARQLLKIEPENPQTWVTVASVATRLMRQEEALEAYERAARFKPDEVRLLTSIGHVQKTLGKRPESEASYKAALALEPGNGEAYWSLADLKNYSFSDAEIDADAAGCWRAASQSPQRGAAAFRAGQSLRAAPAVPARIRALCAGQRAAPRRCAIRHRALRAPHGAHPRFLHRGVLCRAPAAAATRAARRSSSSGCRAPAPRWWSRSSPAIRAWKARWSCRTSSTSCANSRTWLPTGTAIRRASSRAPAAQLRRSRQPLPGADRAAAPRT